MPEIQVLNRKKSKKKLRTPPEEAAGAGKNALILRHGERKAFRKN